ncbi:hypothetical protein F2Q69_00040484 [Brassica cretica]|uniref:Uncharacterized protein n=1 Tax=Brassica cretica TaxID=69181 RepID=A0A8S9N7Y5_BRACR|nr:hypothetical protein F2Q69_00040484 [Brassica cretica]
MPPRIPAMKVGSSAFPAKAVPPLGFIVLCKYARSTIYGVMEVSERRVLSGSQCVCVCWHRFVFDSSHHRRYEIIDSISLSSSLLFQPTTTTITHSMSFCPFPSGGSPPINIFFQKRELMGVDMILLDAELTLMPVDVNVNRLAPPA